MNRKLQDSSKPESLPECIEEFLDYGSAISCAFNRFGTLLATGTNNGYIGIWDFETRGLPKALPDESHDPQDADVTALCWSHNGCYLLTGYTRHSDDKTGGSSSAGNRIVLWDVAAGLPVHEVLMPSAVTHVALTPHKPFVAVVSLGTDQPLVVDLSQDTPTTTALDLMDLKAVLAGAASSKQRGGAEQGAPWAILSKTGREVFVAQQQSGKGCLLVYDLDSRNLLDVYKLPAPVAAMVLNRQGTVLVLNCTDKVIRLADVCARGDNVRPLSQEEAQAKIDALGPDALGSLLLGGHSLLSIFPLSYQNAVEKNPWLCAAITHDCEHVVGASASTHLHKLCVWNKLTGKLVRILEGPRNEGVKALAWHPHRSLMVTLSTNGKVYIWAPIYNEQWSAFAPEFKEIEENEEYVEDEDEFDINKRQSLARGDAEMTDVEVELDILAREPPLGSDEEDAQDSEEPLRQLPAVVQADAADGAADKDAAEPQSSGHTSEEDAAPDVSTRTGAGADSDGGTDQPAVRKRKVRFETKDVEMDDAAFDELLRRQQEEAEKHSKSGPKGSRPRGRPPLARAKEYDAPGQLHRPAAVSGPGNLLNPPGLDAYSHGAAALYQARHYKQEQ